MEPLKPEMRSRILDENPEVRPSEIDEYERLLSRRFTIDPDLPTAARDEVESRLAELHRRLFPHEYSALHHGR